MTIEIPINLKEIKSISETDMFVKSGLAIVEEMMLEQVEGYHPDLKAAISMVISAGGKRIRPKLILLIGKLLDASHEPLFHLACAIEMLHTATLVHDDLIDGSLLRRGIETINAKWSPAATVLAGDFLFAAASEMASRTNSVEVMRIISRSLMTIVNGEVSQLFRDSHLLTIEDYYRVINAKTASLFEASTHAAAVISNVRGSELESLRQFGYNLGMAFQITDDILDYTGSAATTGKPVCADLHQGIVTLPLLFFTQQHPDDPSVRKLLDQHGSLEHDEIELLMIRIRTSSALDLALDEANKFAVRAETCLMELRVTPEHEALVEITRNSIYRLF